MTYLKNLFIITIAATILSSCRKFIAIQPSPNLISTEAIFSNDNTAISAVNGVYLQMRSLTTSITNAGVSLFAGLSADEIYNTASNITYDPFVKNELLASTGTISSSFWAPAYRIIYRTNAILEGLEASHSLTDTVKKQLSGEMKLTRALHYFYLVNLFGDVPLVLTSDYMVNATMARTPVETVYQQIIKDLQDAEELLLISYYGGSKARPNRSAATALLARVWLYRKEWDKAEAASTVLINQGTYSLVTNMNNVFLKNSAETIWEIASSNDAANTSQGSNFIPSSATVKPTFAATTQLLNAFEANDQRKLNWLKANQVSSVSYYYPYKYKVRSGTTVTENLIVLRLGEQYLIRAEARAERNDLAGALADLNTIRSRAGLSNSVATTKDQVLDAIAKERFTELFTEWGDRWLNLKRTARANEVLSLVKGSLWQANDQLYPLPQGELDINVFLTQNPGY